MGELYDGRVSSSFQQFVSAVRRRRSWALSRLVADIDELALRTIRRRLPQRLRQRCDSGDLLQGFWLSVFKRAEKIPQFSDRGILHRYMDRIAERQVSKQYRHHVHAQCRSLRRQVSIEEVETLENSEDTSIEESDLLDILRSQVSVRDREIVDLKLAGKSNREVGKVLGMDEGSVRRALRRVARAFTGINS